MADNIRGIPFSSDDEGTDFSRHARVLVMEQINIAGIGTRRGEPIDPISFDDIYVVWSSFILGNFKAFLSTSRPDGRVWEVTRNKGKKEWYVDSYLKTHNICIPE
jgi:hypothetical protein